MYRHQLFLWHRLLISGEVQEENKLGHRLSWGVHRNPIWPMDYIGYIKLNVPHTDTYSRRGRTRALCAIDLIFFDLVFIFHFANRSAWFAYAKLDKMMVTPRYFVELTLRNVSLCCE